MKHTNIVAITSWNPALGLISLRNINGDHFTAKDLGVADTAHVYLHAKVKSMGITKANNRWRAVIEPRIVDPGGYDDFGPNHCGYCLMAIEHASGDSVSECASKIAEAAKEKGFIKTMLGKITNFLTT